MTPTINTTNTAMWGWRGAHRGAGVTTIARQLGGADLGLRTPDAHLPTLVVCRSTFSGLLAAQQLARDELADTPLWKCLGLVVVPPNPKPLAGPVAELMDLIVGGYPAYWTLPWVESWQTNVQPNPSERTSRSSPNQSVLPPGVASLLHPLIRPPGRPAKPSNSPNNRTQEQI